MPTRIYHWKHGWIPLTHAAALSKAHGSETGAAKILGNLHPVAHEHLPRGSYVIAGHGGNGTFTLLDKKSGRTTRISDAQASVLHGNGQTITGIDEHGNVTATSAAHGSTWQKISAADALGPPSLEAQASADRHRLAGGDGLTAVDKAAARIKQAYRHADGHTVLIETTMNRAHTTAFLDSIHHVTANAGRGIGDPVTFHVPTGDRNFRDGRTLAYVRRGQDTVFVSPKVAQGDGEQPKGTDHFMPAHEHTTTQRYTLAHELGHIIDHRRNHTAGVKKTVPATTAGKTQDVLLFNEFKGQFSRYGVTSPQEAYAEAYAQWHSGMSNPIADAYARKYGWMR